MAQATVDLGLNTAAFTAGLNEAERRSQSFEGRIAGLFRRSPLQRAERAFGELGANLASGNVAQGLASFVGRITGFGLITGAVVGAAIGVFQKFRGEVNETTKAATELDKALAISGYASSAAQVEKSIEAISASIAAVSKKAGGIVATLFGKIAPRYTQGLKDELDAALAQFAELEAARPRAEGKLTAVQAEALMGSEREAELATIRLDKEAQIANIRARQTQESEKAMESLGKADPAKRQAAMDAIRKSAEASVFNAEAAAALREQKANNVFDIKEKELAIDKDIAEQALRGVSAEDQKISKLEQQLRLIQEQLSGSQALTSENRKQLETTQAKTAAELALAKAQATGRPLLSERDVHERAKVSLEDIAAGPGRQARIPINLADEMQFGEQAKQLGSTGIARQALRDEALARQAALSGNLPLAEKLREMADKLKENIPELKSSEKPATMAEVLKDIKQGPSLKDIKSQDVMEKALLNAGKGPEIVAAINELKAKMDSYWGN